MKQAFEITRNFCVRRKAYILSFLIPAAVLLAAYAFFGVYPFGERSVLALDLNAQYVYYFDYMYDVFAGRESIFYCWSRTLSGEFAGIFAYYLASPFNFIVWLFPRTKITEGLLAMLLVKSSAAGLSCAFMLKGRRGFSDLTAVLFSAAFAMSGYFAAHTINPMWLDGLIALPFVVTGVERIWEKRGFLLYAVSMIYIFTANFYIGYMVGIFSALYFVYYFVSGKSGAKGAANIAKSAAVYAMASLGALLSCCWVILPVYKSLSLGKFEHGTPDFTPAENFNIADIFIKLFPGTFDTIRPEGLPMLYCGTLTLIFAAVYFIFKNVSLRERAAGGALLGILTVSMYVKPVDMIWHGGRVPVWMPFRYSFIISFLLILFGAQAFENIKSVPVKSIGAAFALLLGALLFSDYYGGTEHFDTTLIILIPLAALAVISAASALYKKYFQFRRMKIFLTLLVCAELLINASVTLNKMHKDIYYSTRDSYLEDIPETRSITDRIHGLDGGFYRMEKTYHRCVNDDMALRMYGVSHSTSTLNAKALDLVRALGYGSRDHYSRYDGATMLTDDILGIKYVLSKESLYVPYTDTLPVENDIGVGVYENKDALGFAYLADKGIIGGELSGGNPFEVQESLASLLSGEREKIFYPVSDIVFDSTNINIGSTTDGHISYKKRIADDDASVFYKATMPHKGKAYVYFPTKYERECRLYVNDAYIKNYFENENHSIAYLGDYEKGETFTAELKLRKDSLYYENAQFFYIDEEKLAAFNGDILSRNAETAVERTDTAALEIRVNAAEDCALFTSIPYEEGWTAQLDGVNVPLKSGVNGALLCLDVPEGAHKITLKFFPAGLKTGLIFSASGIILLVIMTLISKCAPFPKLSESRGNDDESY